MNAQAERTEMAKTKRPKKDEPAGDFFQLKLPTEYWHWLQAAEAKTGRSMSVSAQIALEMYLRAIGVDFTPNWPEIA